MDKFSLDNVEKSTQEITKYIQESMKKMGCGTFEIEEYLILVCKRLLIGLIQNDKIAPNRIMFKTGITTSNDNTNKNKISNIGGVIYSFKSFSINLTN